MVETKIIPIVNKNLFSDHYIKERLPQKLEEWREEEKIKEVFKKITELYNAKKELLSKYNEAQLEDNFIKPILKEVLGHHFEVQETTYKKGKQPDYAFFPDEKTKEDAIKHKGEKDFYIKAIAVGDAKKWDLPLDKKVKGGAAFEDQNPSFQIDTYLRETSPRWAILTNGRCWRIYYQETSYPLDSYYEIDLIDIIERKDLEDFKYFYFFFRLRAFLEEVAGKNFLDKVYGKSIDYAKELGEGLQNNIYESLKILAEGFLNRKENNLIKNKDTIKIIHDNSLVLLYRIIFILYCETEVRGLLDITKDIYNKTYSLNSLKKEIAEGYNKGKEFYPHLDDYWHKLNNLFTLINEGSKARDIPEKDFFIPPYNGGLFDTQKNRFLTEKSIGDQYLARVIDLLARSNGGFVDYSTLDIRHLGSIYEGLLMYRLNIADEDMVAIKEKGKEKWILKKDADGKKICDEVNKGGLYLTTDKGERKATGSYYTPEYIVKYIVKNTLEPVVEEKLKDARKNNAKESKAILSIKVLDPAMGSGHFLVEVVDSLTKPLLEAIANDVEKGLLPEGEYSTEWVKREIVSHCIYGVDLNPLAVELAKLSLWLRTIAKDKPLSFLDHRIKCGNSLIGAKLADVHFYPEIKGKAKKAHEDKAQQRLIPSQFIEKLLDGIRQIDTISNDTLEAIKTKEELFEKWKQTEAYRRIKALADIRTAVYFGCKPQGKDPVKQFGALTWAIVKEDSKQWEEEIRYAWKKEGLQLAEQKRFFHWELEFPEVFYEVGKEKENPGFDAVVGNPPYGSVRDKLIDAYLREVYVSTQKEVDKYEIFMEASINKNKYSGFLGFIVPNQYFLNYFSENLRKFLLINTQLNILGILPFDVFPDATVQPSIIICTKTDETSNGPIFVFRSDNPSEIKIDYNITIQQDSLASKVLFIFEIPRKIELLPMIKKIRGLSISLEELSKINNGIKCRPILVKTEKLSPNHQPYIYGTDISRYNILWGNLYIEYDKKLEEKYSSQAFREEEIFKTIPKLLVRRIYTNQRLDAVVDFDRFYVDQTIQIIRLNGGGFDINYLCALLNSKLLSMFYNQILADFKVTFSEVKIYQLGQLPIRTISFTTPKDERNHLVAELKNYYILCNFDKILSAVKSFLLKDKEGNFVTDKEKSDVVHDVLAFLAEQMIEMNKQKQTEIKGFTEWLEREIGAKINDLSNKTAIKEYYKNNFEKLIEVLKKNKKKLSIDPSRREFQEKVKSEFDKSRAKLVPLRERIQATDDLIDQIVYKLYGLTDEEIKIVEESLIGKDNSISKKEA